MEFNAPMDADAFIMSLSESNSQEDPSNSLVSLFAAVIVMAIAPDGVDDEVRGILQTVLLRQPQPLLDAAIHRVIEVAS